MNDGRDPRPPENDPPLTQGEQYANAPPPSGLSRTQRFMRTSGINPTFVIVVGGAIVLLVIIIIGWRAFFGARTTTISTTRDGTTVTAEAPGVNGTNGGTPFVLPTAQAPSPTPNAGLFPFGASPTPLPIPSVRPTPYVQPTNPPPPPASPRPSVTYVAQTPAGGVRPFPTNVNGNPTGGGTAPTTAARSSTLAFGGANGGDDVPALDNGAPGSAPSGTNENGAATTATAQPRSSSFAPEGGTGRTTTTLDTAREAQFVADQTQAKIGYVRTQSECTIAITTFIAIRLKSKIVSDLPGPFVGDVMQPIYDKTSHNRTCVPAGTRVFANYDNGLISGQNRLLALGATLVFPDGREFQVGGLPVTDAQGASGMTGDTDTHRGAVIAPAFILTGVAAAEAVLSPQQATTSATGITTPSVGQQARAAAGQQLSNVAGQLVQRSIARPPTIIVRPPAVIQLLVTHDLPLDPYYATSAR